MKFNEGKSIYYMDQYEVMLLEEVKTGREGKIFLNFKTTITYRSTGDLLVLKEVFKKVFDEGEILYIGEL